MTRFEQIAAAFPLHAQRIAECVWECEGNAAQRRALAQDNDASLRRLMTEPPLGDDDAGLTLSDLFDWWRTDEGHDYWHDLAVRQDT